ncbi:MAG: GAF domain-containing sensor histidine kinase [Leptolyngbya sp. SIOISBB]|nr:GAF domain-containing sensor histidine kinase [Leptolyngbya sp. SIOISBB]
MPASAEFAALCQSQLAMMAKLMGADSTAVYIAEGWSDQKVPDLLPVALYPPEAHGSSARAIEKILPAQSSNSAALQSPQRLMMADSINPEPPLVTGAGPAAEPAGPLQRLAIPMMHEGGMLGVLVGWRADRPWLDIERARMEDCAQSLTLACVLDQRGQWLKTQVSALDQVQAQQSDRFHELLHQLRSPLTALKTFGKLLTKRLPTEDTNRRLVTNMLRESDRMQELLGYFDETLQAADDSREEAATTVPLLLPGDDRSGPMPSLTASTGSLAHFGGVLTPQSIAIASVVLPLVELTQPLAEDADMQLQAVFDQTDLMIRADLKALTESLSILLDNALKYATPGSQVWIEWGWSRPDSPDLVGILVGDTGPGIPQRDQDRIFERHYRGLQAAGDLAGSGLGLAIAADLIQEMHGHIQVFSPLSELPYALPEQIDQAAQQHGTAFVIWLPRAN